MVDPFLPRTLAVTCVVRDPLTGEDYPKDPRNIARNAERYMRSLGVADEARVGPEARRSGTSPSSSSPSSPSPRGPNYTTWCGRA